MYFCRNTARFVKRRERKLVRRINQRLNYGLLILFVSMATRQRTSIVIFTEWLAKNFSPHLSTPFASQFESLAVFFNLFSLHIFLVSVASSPTISKILPCQNFVNDLPIIYAKPATSTPSIFIRQNPITLYYPITLPENQLRYFKLMSLFST